MASRAAGALLGFTAAAALGVSIAMPAWWDGHPIIAGHETTAKDVHVGLVQAIGCNTGGAGDCQSFALEETVQWLAWGVAGAAGLAALLSLFVAIGVLREKGKLVSKLAIAIVVIAAAGGGGLLLLGPGIESKQQVELPLGWAMYVFFGGVAACGLASVLTLAWKPEPLRLKSRLPTPPGLPDFDVASLQPAAPRQRAERNDFSQEENVGTLPTPLFDGSGSQPVASPFQVDSRPTGAAYQGINLALAETMSSESIRAESEPIEPPAPTTPFPRIATPLPKPPTAPPPRPSQPAIPPRVSASAMPPAPRAPVRPTGPLPPGPSTPRTPLPGVAPRPSQPAIPRGSQPAISKPTLPHAVPPPPETTPPPSGLKTGRIATDPDQDLPLRDTDAITSVEVDAEAKAAARASQRLDAPTGSKLSRAITAPRPDTESSDTHDTGVSPIVSVGVEIHHSATIQAQMEIPPDEPAPELAPTAMAPPVELAPTAMAPPIAVPASDAPRPATQVPMSTAPTSLPPPKAIPTTPSGPTPACPQCESPMAWVEEHLRFYCKQCRMYF